MEEQRDRSIQGLLFQVARRYFSRSFGALEKIGVHPGQIRVLEILKAENGISQRELVRRLYVKPSTVTVMIQRMNKAGLVERKTDQTDQRVMRIYLTEQGRKAYKEVCEVSAQLEAQLIYGFTEEEQQRLRSYFNRLRDNLAEPAAGQTTTEGTEFCSNFLNT